MAIGAGLVLAALALTVTLLPPGRERGSEEPAEAPMRGRRPAYSEEAA